MEQIQTLKETGTQLRGSDPDRSPAHYEEVRGQVRFFQQLRSRSECRHTHQDYRHHQAALQQPQNCTQETVKTAEPGLLHHPASNPGGEAEQEHDGKKDDKETEYLS